MIVQLILGINAIPMGIEPRTKFLVDWLLFGLLPGVVGWGIWWIRKS